MSHDHDATCWFGYDPCGEHHRHDYNCGNGTLRPSCPDYREELERKWDVVLYTVHDDFVHFFTKYSNDGAFSMTMTMPRTEGRLFASRFAKVFGYLTSRPCRAARRDEIDEQTEEES